MSTPQIHRIRRWPYFLGSAVVVLVLVYFIVSSSFFVRRFVLPKVETALGSKLEVEEISVSPFSQLFLKKVKITPNGAEPLAAVDELRVRYGLFAIIGGKIKVREISVQSPQLTVIEKADGSSNLDAFLKGLKTSDTPPGPRKEAPRVEITNVSLKNGLVRLTRQLRDGRSEVTELNGWNLTLDRLQNGGSGKLTFGAGITVGQVAGRLTAKLDGSLDIALTPQLEPANLRGAVNLEISQADGAFKDFEKLAAVLETEVAATEVKQLRLSFKQAGQVLGFLRVSGPFDLQKSEARLAYELSPLDRRVLGLAGAGKGIDVGQTTVSASGRLDVTQLGQIVASNGRLLVKDFSVRMTNGVTPVIQAAVDYQVSLQPRENTALIQRMDLTATQQGRDLIKAGLDRPMNLAWGRGSQGFRESTFTLGVTNLNLADWRPFTGDSVIAGLVGGRLNVQADRDGRLLRLTLGGDVRELAVRVGTNRVDGATLALEATANVEDVDPVKATFRTAGVERYQLRVERGGQRVATVTGVASAVPADRNVGVQANAEIELPALLQAVPVADVKAEAGRLKFTGRYDQRNQSTNVSATITLDGFTGAFGEMKFQGYQATVQATADIARDVIDFQRAAISAQTGFSTGGSLDFDGKYDVAKKSGRFTFKTVNVNESALGPFLAAAIQPNRLKSVSLDLNGTATYEAAGESAIQSDLRVSKLIVDDPAGRLPKSPLGATLSVDGRLKGSVIELRKFLVGLGPTARATNEVLVTGRFDFATNNPAPSTLAVKSDGLDLTTLYNLFMGATNSPPATPAPAPSADPNVEPAPIPLPLARLEAEVKLAKVYLREMAMTNFVAKAVLNHSKVEVKPLQFSLNGAPVNATLAADVGVPGYTYDLKLAGDQIPVTPLAKSFLTGPRVDLHGRLTAKASIKGAGVTARNLRQHLAADVDFAASGLDYQVTAVKTPVMKTLVTVLITVLKLPRLDQSPIDGISLKAVAGQGIVTLNETRISSPAFVADLTGKILLADILTNSAIKLPVGLSVTMDGKSEKLPDFLTIGGTWGTPKSEIDPIGLVKVGSRLPGGIGTAISGGLNKAGTALEKATGGLIPNLGNLVTGEKPAEATTATTTKPEASAANPSTAASKAATNAPAQTNKVGGLLQGLGNILGGRGATNAPAATNKTATATNKPAALSKTNKSPATAIPPAPKK
jgi:hypothetical protein